MNDAIDHNDKAKLAALAWYVALTIAIIGFPLIRNAVGSVLMKLYEFFIQRNALNS